MTRAFLDSNVILYLLSSDAGKADRAEALLTQGGVVSVQVLNEVTSVMRRKLSMPWDEIHDVLSSVRQLCTVVPLTVAVHERGIEMARQHQLSVYDAMIAAAALQARCSVLWTEDLQDGQWLHEGLQVRNPFA